VVFVQIGALNRVVQETNELGYSRYFAYNDGGYLTRRIDRRGLVREFLYDTLGRNTAEIWYDTAADAEMDANRQNTLNFTYDALGRMLSAGDQFASYAYAYDHLGRMTSSDAAIAGLVPTVTLTNAYDAAGRRTQVAAAIGGSADFVTNYAYDQLGRTTSIQQSTAGTANVPTADKRVDFTYDLANQPVTLTRYADLAGNQLVAATDYLFDQAGRLTGMTHAKGASVFADYDWTFDEANRMTRFESLIDGVADYTNDDTGQLTGAEYTAGAGLPTAPPDEQYVYDENGNRINNGYTVGPNNQLLSDGEENGRKGVRNLIMHALSFLKLALRFLTPFHVPPFHVRHEQGHFTIAQIHAYAIRTELATLAASAVCSKDDDVDTARRRAGQTLYSFALRVYNAQANSYKKVDDLYDVLAQPQRPQGQATWDAKLSALLTSSDGAEDFDYYPPDWVPLMQYKGK
jgi:YD repeat-containing protein